MLLKVSVDSDGIRSTDVVLLELQGSVNVRQGSGLKSLQSQKLGVLRVDKDGTYIHTYMTYTHIHNKAEDVHLRIPNLFSILPHCTLVLDVYIHRPQILIMLGPTCCRIHIL